MESYVNVNAIFCEEANTNNKQLDIKGIFNVIEDINKEDLSKGFNIVVLLNARGSLNCTIYVILESKNNDKDSKARKLIEIPLQLEDDIITNKINIIRFTSKKLLSESGNYEISVYKIDDPTPNLSISEIVQGGENISSTILQVIK